MMLTAMDASKEVIAQGFTACEAAAERARINLREVHDLEGEAAVSALLDRVWGTGAWPVMPANLLHAVAHAGNYLAAAVHEGRIVGAAFGFLGVREGEVFLHSHMTGVDPAYQRGGVGFALKLHQRVWAMKRGLKRIEWTFDPLVRGNAYFNLVKLGAEVVDYHVNFYGEMADAINSGDESDRVLVSWQLASQRAAEACEKGLSEPDVDQLRAAGADVLLDQDARGRPKAHRTTASVLLCHIPEDAVALRKQDPQAALEWRHALRDTFGGALRSGHRATAITRDGWYVLEGKAS